jgi:hypothetical protein
VEQEAHDGDHNDSLTASGANADQSAKLVVSESPLRKLARDAAGACYNFIEPCTVTGCSAFSGSGGPCAAAGGSASAGLPSPEVPGLPCVKIAHGHTCGSAASRGGNSGATAEPRRSTREGKGVPAMAFDPTPQTRSEQLAVQKAAALAATTQQPPEQVEPACYAEAISCAACDQWRQAMDTEMSKHHERGTYVLCEKPRDRTIVGCKWVYKLKRDNKGNITSYKARLVATGFSQKPGINYCCSG